MSITTYENVMECRFKDVHKTNTVKLCEVIFVVILQVRFEKIWQIEFGKIKVSKRIKDYIRSLKRAVFFNIQRLKWKNKLII